MKQASGISKIEYKIIGSSEIHTIPFVKEKAKCPASVENTKSGEVSKVRLQFKVIENQANMDFIYKFLKNYRQLLLFRCTFISGLVRVVGSEDHRCKVELSQETGEKPGDFTGYNIDVLWVHPLYL